MQCAGYYFVNRLLFFGLTFRAVEVLVQSMYLLQVMEDPLTAVHSMAMLTVFTQLSYQELTGTVQFLAMESAVLASWQ